jgi:predicted GIY-YIG superfamily endonuclease
MSRSTKKSYINLIDYKPKVSTGYVYKITDDKGKNYIGSTNDYKKRWEQHKQAGEDKYDSICNGYNTKHSVDMFNLY